MEDLKGFLQKTLSVKDYESFHEKINISKTRLTQLLRDPLTINARELVAICNELDMPLSRFIKDFIMPLYEGKNQESVPAESAA